MITKKVERITENIFDVIMNTTFHDVAKLQLNKDLSKHNVFVDKRKGLIEIQNYEGTINLYTITISKL